MTPQRMTDLLHEVDTRDYLGALPDLRPCAPADVAGLLAAFNLPHPRPFACEINIGPSHVGGTVAHVSNIEYVRWLDRAAQLHADSLGYTRVELLRRGIMWFVARHEIDYLAEAWPDDRLIVATWVRTMQKVKSWRDYVIVRPRDGAEVCRAATLWVLVNLESRRPIRHTPQMAEDFKPLNMLDVPAAQPPALA